MASKVNSIGKRALVLAVAAAIAVSIGASAAQADDASSAHRGGSGFVTGFWDGPP